MDVHQIIKKPHNDNLYGLWTINNKTILKHLKPLFGTLSKTLQFTIFVIILSFYNNGHIKRMLW